MTHRTAGSERPPLTPVADQVARVLAACDPLPAHDLPLSETFGHRLAKDVHALLAVPPWDNSAMDGYAVRAADVAAASAATPVTLRVVADLPAGSALDPPIGPGEAVRIMTGAALPTAADAVVQLEHTDRDDPLAPLADTVTVLRAGGLGRHVRRAGEDKQVGGPIARAGSRITGALAAALASAGYGTAPVRPRPRVAVVATGSELVDPGAPIGRGQIPDSNSLLVAGLLRECGALPSGVYRVADEPDRLQAVLRRVLTQPARPDVVILTGGVSQGAFDPVKQVFAAGDELTFTTVAMQPGKPQGFGRLAQMDGTPGPLVFALPGNPVSVWVSFQVFVRPALLTLAGAPPEVVHPAPQLAVVESGWRTPGGRDQYLPARLRTNQPHHPDQPSQVLVSPVAALGSKSHLAASLAGANGYALITAARQAASNGAPIRPGDLVSVVPLDLELPPPLSPAPDPTS